MIRVFLWISFAALIFIGYHNFQTPETEQVLTSEKYQKLSPDLSRLHSKAEEATKYCRQKNLNRDFFFLIDLSIHSGLKRFFVWDLKNDSITYSFLVSHGCYTYPYGEDFSKEKAVTSNMDGSHCSSIGKYMIGNRGYSNWGINVNYLLHGQDTTNNNALKREIVLHSWNRISDTEIFPTGSPEGWGCPAVSNNAMKILDSLLKNSENRILLWTIE